MSTANHFRVVHRTSYRYGSPVTDGFTMAHLLPRATPSQRVISAEVVVDPLPDEMEERADVFGNRVVRFAVHRAHHALVVEAVSEIVHEPQLFLGEHPSWEHVAHLVATTPGEVATNVAPFVAPSALARNVAGLSVITAPIFTAGRSVIDAVIDLNRAIYDGFRFDPGFSDVTTPVATVLEARRGVCQDFAHVGVACLRSMGLAARYVSGYIETLPPPGQPKLVGADASHAWCSVWLPGFGWLDFDPTNHQIPPLSHVTVGWGRDYADVAPVRGVVIGAGRGQELTVGVDVTRLPPID